ncbi:MAG: Gfo/Idh/MocA family oxidoreductase [Chloroflexi bacterium]|nr:Gfo/Idh/MocA family oxidoreductase [Chloroflexota bacterium]
MPSASSKVRIGIIGVGGFANTHMEHFGRLGHVEVVAAMRRNPEALAEFQNKWDIPNGFTDHRELLAMDGLDAVVIVTPTGSHKQLALDSIEAGKHVLCDKPLALTAADCKEMLDAAAAAGVVHSTNFNQRGNTTLGRIKRYLDNDFLGRIYHANIWWGQTQQFDARPDALTWRFRSENGGGSVYELIHAFDMLRFINGEVSRVVATFDTTTAHRPTADNPEGIVVDVPDASGFLCEWQNGGFAVVHTSFASRGTDPDGKTSPRVEISGEHGRITTDGRYGILGVTGPNGPVGQLDPGPEYPQPYQLFADAVLAGDQSLVETSFYDGMKAAEIVDAAYLSVAESRWIELSHG